MRFVYNKHLNNLDLLCALPASNQELGSKYKNRYIKYWCLLNILLFIQGCCIVIRCYLLLGKKRDLPVTDIAGSSLMYLQDTINPLYHTIFKDNE